jgi:uncharacterized membrane protein YqiK
MAKADAQALLEQAAAAKDEMLAKAEGTAAIVAAENTQTSEVIAMKLDQARIEVLPDVVEKMLKPTEKIESIRINHITGIGGGTGGDGGGRAAGGNGVNDVIDGVLGLALQLPAVKKLGEEVGLNISNGIKGVTAPLDGGPAKNEDEAEPTND